MVKGKSEDHVKWLMAEVYICEKIIRHCWLALWEVFLINYLINQLQGLYCDFFYIYIYIYVCV